MAKKKAALPKSVAGFKVPKSLRKNRLLTSLIASPFGRKILADALIAGAGAAAGVLIQERDEAAEATKAGLRKGGKTMAVAGEAVESAIEAMMSVVTDAARSLLPKEKRDKHAKRHKDKHPAPNRDLRH